jgi:hypothetical protein
MGKEKDWMDYTNLAANIHQSIKLGEISNQLSQLTSINTAMLGNMNNLVNIEVYKLEQEDNEKQFKQLLFNLKKFVKTKYEDPLTVALLKSGHCKMIDSLLDNFQRELTSFEDKEYVENIMDSFSEYSSVDVDFETLAKENEDGVALLLSYMMFTDSISAKEEKLSLATNEIEETRSKYITPMQNWTIENLNDWLLKIGCVGAKGFGSDSGKPCYIEDKEYSLGKIEHSLMKKINEGKKFQIIFDKFSGDSFGNKPNDSPCITSEANISNEKEIDRGTEQGWLGYKGETFKDKVARIEKEVLEEVGVDESKANNLSSEITNSLSSLSDALNKSDSEWINVEKKLLNIMYDTTLPIQGPYQYRNQVIGD